MFINHSDGRKLSVTFSSHFVKNPVGKDVRETTCKFATVDESKIGRERYTPVSQGVVRQNSRDIDCRRSGQRFAFGAAVRNFSKNERRSMWIQYDPIMQIG